MASACLETKVRNVSGKTLSFGYLPPHGRRLAAGEELSFFGNLVDLLSRNKRKRSALVRDLEAGRLVIVETPSQHYFDLTDDVTKVLGVDAGAVEVNDPCWGEYSSSLS